MARRKVKKFGRGEIVQKTSASFLRLTSKTGEDMGQSFGSGSVLILYIVEDRINEYLVQVIPSHQIQKTNMHNGKFCLINIADVKQPAKEKNMTVQKVYDGKTFYPERLKAARSASMTRKKSVADR